MFPPSRVFAAAILIAAAAPIATTQSDPRTLPLLDPAAIANLTLDSFQYDWPDGAGGNLSYGGGALGVSEDGNYLYISCVQDDHGIAKLEIPSGGGMARVAAPCLGPDRAELAKIHPDPSATRPMIGGVLEQNGRFVVTGYISYDSTGSTFASHWAGSSLASLGGPYAATVPPGFVKSQMSPVPPEWRSVLGGPALSSAGYTSIISRASYGASVSVFDPADVGAQNPIPMTMLLGCPHSVPSCITYGTPTSNDYNGSELSGGFFIVPGTRTLAVIEREASGPTCYGYATRDASLHGSPYPSPEGVVWCYSLSDPLNEKGPKGYPYRLVAKLYDLEELVQVRQGNKRPWDIRQYATVDMPGSSPSEFVLSGAFNYTRNEFYLIRRVAGGVNTVHVYRGFGGGNGGGGGTPPPPTERCGDGLDNDGDGLVDEGCAETCGDGLDNDGDGLVDEECAVPEVCGDLIDNDLDGQVDENCAPEYVEVCGDGLDNDGDGSVDEECDTYASVPGPPQRLHGSVDGRTVTLEWQPPLTGSPVEDYVVEVGFNPGESDIVGPIGDVTYLTVPEVGRGRYYVRVRARNGNGESAPSNEVVMSVGCGTRPRRPSSLRAESRGGLVTLAWTDPDGCSGTSYRVEVSTPSGAMVQMAAAESTASAKTRLRASSGITPQNASVTQAEVSALLPPGSYVARVIAQSDTGESDPADLSFNVNGSGCVAPRLRLMLRAVVTGRHVGFYWSPLDPEIAAADDRLSPISYVIEAGSASGAADFGSLPLGRAMQFGVEAPPGTYFIRVRSANACGGGNASNEMRVVIR
jgi:hypothetical protein